MRTNIPSTAQVRNWKMTLPASAEPAAQMATPSTEPAADTDLRHGYTLADYARKVSRGI